MVGQGVTGPSATDVATLTSPSQHEALHSAPISKVGTAHYTAPEVFLSENEYDAKVNLKPNSSLAAPSALHPHLSPSA